MLLSILLLLLPLGANTINGLPGILDDAWITYIGTLDDINTILMKQPWIRYATTITTKWEATQSAVGLVGTVVPAVVASHSFLSMACIDLNGEGLATTADSLAGNGLNIIVLHFGADGGLEHLMEDLVLVGGRALLQLAVVKEVSAEACNEARVKAIHEGLADADKKHILIDE